MKTYFAHVDKAENFTFTFEPGFDDSDIYPGEVSQGIYNNFIHLMFFCNIGGPPSDGTTMKIIHTFNTALVVVFDCLAILGIVFAISCLLFNFIFRNRR